MLYNNQWEVLMITFPLLSNVRQRAMIMPVSPPLTRLIHVRTSYWTIFHSFEIILEIGAVNWIELQIQCSIQIHCFKKTFIPIRIMFKKILNCTGQLGLWWLGPSKARANEVERTPTLNDIVLFRSPATWTRKAMHGTKIYEEPKETRPS